MQQILQWVGRQLGKAWHRSAHHAQVFTALTRRANFLKPDARFLHPAELSNDSSSKSRDNVGKRCRQCGEGFYWAEDLDSVFQGQLQCSVCLARVKREEPLPEKLRIYTDGSFRFPWTMGGWGAVIYDWDWGFVEEHSGIHPVASSCEIEAWAVIRALERLPPGSHLMVCSDSKYVIDGMRGIMQGGDPALWTRLRQAARRHHIHWKWVRGHSGITGNQRADHLAAKALKDAPRGVLGATSAQEPPADRPPISAPPTTAAIVASLLRSTSSPLEILESGANSAPKSPRSLYRLDMLTLTPGAGRGLEFPKDPVEEQTPCLTMTSE